MDKVHEAKDILKVHRQYIRKFHPDKISPTADPEKIYIANFVFTAITEAYRTHVSCFAFSNLFSLTLSLPIAIGVGKMIKLTPFLHSSRFDMPKHS